MTQEYEPIKVNKASEAVAYLEDGGKLYQMGAGHAYPVYIPTVASNWPVYGLYTEKKTAPWYERLHGEKVLCWLSNSDHHPTDKNYCSLAEYSASVGEFYTVAECWAYGTPLTSEEVEKILATHKRLGL